MIVQFWTLAAEIFHSRQAKRLFAIIGGGGILSNIVFGFGTRSYVSTIGTENLLFVVVGCLLISLAMTQALGKDAKVELTQALLRTPTKSLQSSAPKTQSKLFNPKHVKLIGVAVILTYLVSTLVDYQFNVIVKSRHR